MTNRERVWFFKCATASKRLRFAGDVKNNYCNVFGGRAICYYFVWYSNKC